MGEKLLERLTDINGYHLHGYELDNNRHYLISHEKIDGFSPNNIELTVVVNNAINVTSTEIQREMNKNIKPGTMSSKSSKKFLNSKSYFN